MQLGFYSIGTADKSPAVPEIKVDMFEVKSQLIYFVTEINNYKIIKKGLINV